ncbi:hypothetical protein [Desulfonauticus submarinus]
MEKKHLFTWLSFLLVNIMFIGSICSFMYIYKKFKETALLNRQIQTDIHKLTIQINQVEQNKAKIKEWLSILKKIKDMHLTPNFWFTYPVNIKKQVDKESVKQLIYLLSSGNLTNNFYLYVPYKFQLSKSDKLKQNQHNTISANQTINNNNFFLRIQGEFIIKKENSLMKFNEDRNGKK